MTNETNYRTKANAVFFAAIMVVSMVAVGFAAAPAAAAVTGITGDSAGDVTVGNGAATQDVTFSVDVEDGDTDVPVEIDLSQAADADVSTLVSGVSTTGDVSATDDGIDGTTHTVLVSDSANNGSASSGTVTVTYEHNTASLTNDDTTSNDSVTFDISDVTGDITGSVAFDLTTDFTVNGVSADDEVTLFDADGNEVETQTATGTSVTFRELVDGEYTASVPGLSTDSATVTDGASTSVTLDTTVNTIVEPNRSLFYQGQELTVSGLIVGDDYELRQESQEIEDGSSFERKSTLAITARSLSTLLASTTVTTSSLGLVSQTPSSTVRTPSRSRRRTSRLSSTRTRSRLTTKQTSRLTRTVAPTRSA